MKELMKEFMTWTEENAKETLLLGFAILLGSLVYTGLAYWADIHGWTFVVRPAIIAAYGGRVMSIIYLFRGTQLYYKKLLNK